MSKLIYLYIICAICLFLATSAEAAWKRYETNSSKKPSIDLSEWHDLFVMFEVPSSYFLSENGKSFLRNHTQVKNLLVDNHDSKYFTFTKHHKKVVLYSFSEVMTLVTKQYKKHTITKQGKSLLLALYGTCNNSYRSEKCYYIRRGDLKGKSYVIFKSLFNKIQRFSSSHWMTDGIVDLVDSDSYLAVRDSKADEKHRKILAKYRRQEESKKAEKEKRRLEKERNWKEKQAQLKRKKQSERQAREEYKAKRKAEIMSGKSNIRNTDDYSIFHNASEDTEYQYGPPTDGPPNSNLYFDWDCSLVEKRGKYYICWSPREMAGFAFLKVKHVGSGHIMENGNSRVVGKYDHNLVIELLDGRSVLVPVLIDAYYQGY